MTRDEIDDIVTKLNIAYDRAVLMVKQVETQLQELGLEGHADIDDENRICFVKKKNRFVVFHCERRNNQFTRFDECDRGTKILIAVNISKLVSRLMFNANKLIKEISAS